MEFEAITLRIVESVELLAGWAHDVPGEAVHGIADLPFGI